MLKERARPRKTEMDKELKEIYQCWNVESLLTSLLTRQEPGWLKAQEIAGQQTVGFAEGSWICAGAAGGPTCCLLLPLRQKQQGLFHHSPAAAAAGRTLLQASQPPSVCHPYPPHPAVE